MGEAISYSYAWGTGSCTHQWPCVPSDIVSGERLLAMAMSWGTSTERLSYYSYNMYRNTIFQYTRKPYYVYVNGRWNCIYSCPSLKCDHCHNLFSNKCALNKYYKKVLGDVWGVCLEGSCYFYLYLLYCSVSLVSLREWHLYHWSPLWEWYLFISLLPY